MRKNILERWARTPTIQRGFAIVELCGKILSRSKRIARHPEILQPAVAVVAAGRTGCRLYPGLLRSKEGQKRSDCLPEILQPAEAVIATGRTGQPAEAVMCRPHPGPGFTLVELLEYLENRH